MNASASAVRTAAIPMLKKITPKTVCDKLYGPGFLLKLGETRPVQARVLYDVFGVVNGVKQGETEKGTWVKFLGRFRAVGPEGEIVAESGAMHIPVFEDMLHAAINEAKEHDPRARVEIAFRVGIVTAASGKPSATGYEFDVQKLVDTKQDDDPIVRLMNEAAAANKPALPAPGTTTADGPPSAAETPPPTAQNGSTGHSRGHARK